MNGSVERYARNVKRWRGGQMIQRWVASLWWRRNRASGGPAATAIYVTWSAPWTHWPRPTAWLLTWRNMDDS